jgi:hypothetical protein
LDAIRPINQGRTNSRPFFRVLYSDHGMDGLHGFPALFLISLIWNGRDHVKLITWKIRVFVSYAGLIME